MVAGPETARLLTECEEKHSRKKKESERHDEQIPSVQKTFLPQTKNVTDVIEEHGNPFAEDTGKAQHQTFVAERININIAAFNDTVHKNNRGVDVYTMWAVHCLSALVSWARLCMSIMLDACVTTASYIRAVICRCTAYIYIFFDYVFISIA